MGGGGSKLARSDAPSKDAQPLKTQNSGGKGQEPVGQANEERVGRRGSRRLSFGSSTRSIDLDKMTEAVTSTEAGICEGVGFEHEFNAKRHTKSFRLSFMERSKPGRNSMPSLVESDSTEYFELSRSSNFRRKQSSTRSSGGLFNGFVDVITQQAETVKSPYLFFGAVDGHGNDSDALASFTKIFLRSKLRRYNLSRHSPEIIKENLEKIVNSVWVAIQNGESGVNIEENGVMCTVVYYGQRTLVTCTIGDVKCFAVKSKPTEQTPVIVELSPDHTWENEREHKRAISCGSSVRSVTVDNVGILRTRPAVFAQGPAELPGLCQSRFFGMTSAAQNGICHVPETTMIKLDDDSDGYSIDCVVLATDSVWSVLPPAEVRDAVVKAREHARISSFVDAQELSDELLSLATARWEEMWADTNLQVEAFYPDLFEARGRVGSGGSWKENLRREPE